MSGTLRGASLAALHILGAILKFAPSARRSATASRRRGLPQRPVPLVVIMAKHPAPGRTKTRLCPPLTASEAAMLYEALLTDTIGLVSGLRGIEMAIAVTPPEAAGEVAALAPPGARMLAVDGADIGECLRTSFGQLLSQGFTAVVAVNSDSPTLPATYIERAFDLLRDHDVVLGPAEDGGYYLIGLRQNQPGLFHGISWSTGHVAAQTLERIGALGLTVAQLPAWYDVDTPADLDRLRAELAALPTGAAPSTRRVLAGQ